MSDDDFDTHATSASRWWPTVTCIRCHKTLQTLWRKTGAGRAVCKRLPFPGALASDMCGGVGFRAHVYVSTQSQDVMSAGARRITASASGTSVLPCDSWIHLLGREFEDA